MSTPQTSDKLRHRAVPPAPIATPGANSSGGPASPSRRAAPSPRARVPSSTDSEGESKARPKLTPPPESDEEKWKKWNRRFWTTLSMIGGFFTLLHVTRTIGLVLLIILVQSQVYKELVSIAMKQSSERALPGFVFFYWYWFIVAVFFMYGGALKDVILAHSSHVGPTLSWVVSNFNVISYALWIGGLVAFVLSLGSRKLYLYQFSQFGYCHMALLVVVGQSTLLAANVFSGFMWFVIPCGMVVCNDSMAYVCGFFFGKTPLIKLSPKKTWEGFIGGFLLTVVWAFWFTRLLQIEALADFYECPHNSFAWAIEPCKKNSIYVLHPFSSYLGSLSWIVPSFLDVSVSKMMWHAVIMSIFASLVAPFGGFFASGFKRAFRIKDFGDSIPGHGGFTDRMDCQIVMGAFAYMYFHYVVMPKTSVDTIMDAICRLGPEEYATLQQHLGNLSGYCGL